MTVQLDAPLLFVVAGRTGSYSDSQEWCVAAHISEKAAQEHARLAAQEEERLHQLWMDSDDQYGEEFSLYSGFEPGTKYLNRFDPMLFGGSRPATYVVVKVLLTPVAEGATPDLLAQTLLVAMDALQEQREAP